MLHRRPHIFVSIVLLVAAAAIGLTPTALVAGADELNAQLEQAQQLLHDGNYDDAYKIYKSIALNRSASPDFVTQALSAGVTAIQSLNKDFETDEFRSAVVAAHPESWAVLRDVASSISSAHHGGTIIDQKFQRSNFQQGGKRVSSLRRDYLQAFQLMLRAEALIKKDPGASPSDRAGFFVAFSHLFYNYASSEQFWQFQHLTELTIVPDYEEERYPHYYYDQNRGAPVDQRGEPIFYGVPESFEAAKNDGERWRWLMHQAALSHTSFISWEKQNRADFLHRQFGVQTMASNMRYWRVEPGEDDEAGHTFALDRLGEDETICRLATGIRRVRLPEEFNFIKIYRELAEPAEGEGNSTAVGQLATIFTNRRQYDKAEYFLALDLKRYGEREWVRKNYRQVVGNWGRFETTIPQVAGQAAKVDFTFRNAPKVQFEAYRVDLKRILEDVRQHLRNRPRELNWKKLNLTDLGTRIVTEQEEQYLRGRVAEWELKLEPRERHFDRRITVDTPLKEPGAYLLKAKLPDGNTSNIVLFLHDTIIVKKPLFRSVDAQAPNAPESGSYYFVADAVTGKPVAGAQVDFFGYRTVHEPKGGKWHVETTAFSEKSDDQGGVVPSGKLLDRNYQWLTTAHTDSGRLAYLGFSSVWGAYYYGSDFDSQQGTKAFTITDRPVYRPEQTVHFKLWLSEARYDQDQPAAFAGQSVSVRINSPKAEKVFEQDLVADQYGGVAGDLLLAKGATLGQYLISVVGVSGGGSFRVEEYKKPEFEVTVDAPKEALRLGDKFEATVTAKYYFGSPVSEAQVHYKVLRYEHSTSWYPNRPWDWLYGIGYWWFAEDYRWYPGWKHWGCRGPFPWWWQRPEPQPELIVDREVEIGADGKLRIDVDTALAKEIHGDKDHRYEISVEVTDRSRRTIVGSGKVIVTREPFKVYTWLDRGFAKSGEMLPVFFSARTPSGDPVEGKGQLVLKAISYDSKGTPTEKPVETLSAETGSDGNGELKLTPRRPGQYRLSLKVKDKQGREVEGGQIFTVLGEKLDPDSFRFNAIELLPEKTEYRSGEKAQILIQTNRPNSTVLLFVRPVQGAYTRPEVLQISGRSVLKELDVGVADMPNFFVEAMTVSDGQVHSAVRMIAVPPESRILNVEVLPAAAKYRPNEEGSVQLRVTDVAGLPFVGALVISVYDKAVEYISGGAGGEDVKKFFWGWRREHQPQQETNVDTRAGNVVPGNTETMGPLGVFGATVSTEIGGVGGRNEFAANKSLFKDEARRRSNTVPVASMVMEANSVDMLGGGMAPDDKAPSAPPPQGLVEPSIRQNFADTAYWNGAIETDREGRATVKFKMPENLTTWKIRSWALGRGTRVGEGEAQVVTTKNLILRLQAPRFFVERDEVVLSANVHNYLESNKSVRVSLELDGNELERIGAESSEVVIPPQGEKRVDWRVRVLREGTATIRMKALTDEESDAVQMSFPVHVHGMERTEPFSAVMEDGQSSYQFEITVPEQRRPEATRLTVRYSPSIVASIVDALPYLVNYPYGCTEQTLSRFLPTVITQRILTEMGLDLKAIRDKRANLNSQELGDSAERAKQWKQWEENPVFDQDEVSLMVKDGLKRLTEMQLSDGGWGWFSGIGEYSSAHTTAYVVHGLQIAVANGLAIYPGVQERGTEWLKGYQQTELARLTPKLGQKPERATANDTDAFVYMVLADADLENTAMREILYRDRTSLSLYANAMIALVLHKKGDSEKLAMLLQNLKQFLEVDPENQTALLRDRNASWWYWYGSSVEANAYYLKLLTRTDPKGKTTAGVAKYLLTNRKHANSWDSTRSTALAIEALAEFLKATEEHQTRQEVEVYLDGRKVGGSLITPETLFTAENGVVLQGEALSTGKHTVEVRRKGEGRLYVNSYYSEFTKEDYIKSAGLDVKIARKYYLLEKGEATAQTGGSRGQPINQRVEKVNRKELSDLATVTSGEEVEVELIVTTKNEYEYLIFEDRKPAGFEAVELQSGYNGNSLGAFVEFRDDRVSFFVTRLGRGTYSVSYRLRAEIPGRFSALPAKGYAMYAPELVGNSDELKFKIED